MSALTAPTVYLSTDSGAPAVGNTLGDLINFHDAILVNGYPLTTATSLSYASGKVTVNKTAHGMSVGDISTISGANEDEYNGRIEVTDVVDADNYKYVPLSTPSSSPATGTIKFSNHGGKPGLGWQIAFTGTNKRVYRPRTGNRFYLRLEQTLAYNCRARGFETMSDVDTGTGTFPTTVQLTNGVFLQATDNSAGNRRWGAHGDGKQFCASINTLATIYCSWFFGDYISFKTGDAYNTLLAAKNTDTSSTTGTNFGQLTGNFGGLNGHYSPRSYSQSGSSVGMGINTDTSRHNSATMGQGAAGSTAMIYPAPIDGGLHLSRLFVNEPGQGVRGYLRGIWDVCHNFASMSGVAAGDTFSGSDGLSGRTFVLQPVSQNSINGVMAFESSDTLDT